MDEEYTCTDSWTAPQLADRVGGVPALSRRITVAVEPCIVKHCNALVIIRYDRNGGLPIEANGYSGLTDDGEAVCQDHFCPTCGNYHEDAAAFDACEFHGPPAANLALCGVGDPYTVLAAYAR
jgi:hypothetical protein